MFTQRICKLCIYELPPLLCGAESQVKLHAQLSLSLSLFIFTALPDDCKNNSSARHAATQKLAATTRCNSFHWDALKAFFQIATAAKAFVAYSATHNVAEEESTPFHMLPYAVE